MLVHPFYISIYNITIISYLPTGLHIVYMRHIYTNMYMGLPSYLATYIHPCACMDTCRRAHILIGCMHAHIQTHTQTNTIVELTCIKIEHTCHVFTYAQSMCYFLLCIHVPARHGPVAGSGPSGSPTKTKLWMSQRLGKLKVFKLRLQG